MKERIAIEREGREVYGELIMEWSARVEIEREVDGVADRILLENRVAELADKEAKRSEEAARKAFHSEG